MVSQCPVFFAIRQQRRFSSSSPVTAIKRSALSTPASCWILKLAPFPTIPRASNWLERCSTFCGFISTITRSWPSALKRSARLTPTFPQPTMMIFICLPVLSINYASQRPEAPHGSTSLELVTGSPISSELTVPPNCGTTAVPSI